MLPMVPLATNGTIGKISNGTIGRIPNARSIWAELHSEGASVLERFSTFVCNIWVTGHFGPFFIAHNKVLCDEGVILLPSECPIGALIFSSYIGCAALRL